MQRLDEAPSIVPDMPSLAADKANVSVAGIFVAAGPLLGPAHGRLAAVGDLLLAKERGLEAWHECEVVGVNDDLLTLVWSGLPDSELFTRRFWQLATIHLPKVKLC
jgi:hypothetical protein